MAQIQLQRVLAHIEGDCRWARGESCLWWMWDTEHCFFPLPLAGLFLVRCSDYISSLIGQPLLYKESSDFYCQLLYWAALSKCLLINCPFTRRPSWGKCGNALEFGYVDWETKKSMWGELDSQSNRFLWIPIHLPFSKISLLRKISNFLTYLWSGGRKDG